MARVKPVETANGMQSWQVRAHCPELQEAMETFFDRLWSSSRIDAALKELLRLRCAHLNTCSY